MPDDPPESKRCVEVPSSVPIDFDASYDGTPPWEIGGPQPALAELAAAGLWHGKVLDVGCGTGEHALLAASLGLRAAGFDLSPKAIAIARRKAEYRSLEVRFEVRDALDPGLAGEQFDTVVDSGLFHLFDDAGRARYVESLRAVVAPAGRCFLLCFGDCLPDGFGPRRVSEAELRSAFADGWQVDEIVETRLSVTFLPTGFLARRCSLTRV